MNVLVEAAARLGGPKPAGIAAFLVSATRHGPIGMKLSGVCAQATTDIVVMQKRRVRGRIRRIVFCSLNE